MVIILGAMLCFLVGFQSCYQNGDHDSPTSFDTLTVCSFNVQFLGHFKDRDDAALCSLLKDYDIVVIQELVAPPCAMDFPDGTPVKPDAEAAEFFNEMANHGFSYLLSEEDTGTNEEIHTNTTGTEWWVAFYKPTQVTVANDLSSGFLADDRSNNDSYERVPYAFAFRTLDSNLDFVLISVHLQPGSSSSETARREQELASIAAWVDANDSVEKDFIILGDMNVQDHTELADITPEDFVSLNDDCLATNTAATGKPYDHVMYRPAYSHEVQDGLVIVKLVEEMKAFWTASEPYPGNPYEHNAFRVLYSDHNPIVFQIEVPESDDD
jgi:exonuclease III